jgi:putative solute:sodium symporter small subunit
MQLTEKQEEYWRRTVRVTVVLLLIWFVVTFVLAWGARSINFNFFGWPFSFWVGAQGALLVYLGIIVYYARFMNRLDREYGVEEGED